MNAEEKADEEEKDLKDKFNRITKSTNETEDSSVNLYPVYDGIRLGTWATEEEAQLIFGC